MTAVALGIAALERGFVPDAVTRAAVRRLCGARLREEAGLHGTPARRAFEESLRTGPIAPVPEKANEQHYELPAEFFELVLGPRRKYSCCCWDGPPTTLAAGEDYALSQTCERAELADGQEILELGCGWGSLSLWMAERYPQARITAVSNSHSQRTYIEARACELGLSNLRIVTADMNDFAIEAGRFDRVVSVEMFEHMRNYHALLKKIASWLRPDGKLFVHYFCHARLSYPFETEAEDDWMARHFFTGGQMPSEHLLDEFAEHLRVEKRRRWSGRHYQATSELWLRNLDARRAEVLPILARTYGRGEARVWFQRWRVFFLAVAELFGYNGGGEWFVSHQLLVPTSRT
ncbi:MAG: class I SAM-dependent methyltransferase [Planctomycetaceae bacterium]|nr:class I SAM-dependent methyltransferase [Planctomycetaceae bacterium]